MEGAAALIVFIFFIIILTLLAHLKAFISDELIEIKEIFIKIKRGISYCWKEGRKKLSSMSFYRNKVKRTRKEIRIRRYITSFSFFSAYIPSFT